MRTIQWLSEKSTRLLMALSLMVVLQGLYAQTWIWQQQCSSNEWSTICGGTVVCGTNPTTYAYYGNWGTWSCGYNPSALRPGPGSTAVFPSGANALLASEVDIRNVSINNGATLAFTAGTLRLRHPENDAPGTLTVQSGGLFQLPSTSSYRSLAGVVVNTGTLRHEATNLYWSGASVQSSGTIELLAGNWYNNSGTNSAQNTGTVVKSGTGIFTLDVPFDNRGTVSVQQGELRVSNHISGTNGVWNVASGATLGWTGTGNLSGSHSGAVAGYAYLSGTRTVIAPTTLNLSGNGLAFVSGTLNAGSAGLTNAGVFRLPSTSSSRSLAGVVVNTGTLRHEASGLWWDGASVQSSGTIELLAGNWYNNSGTNSAQNTGTVVKSGTGTFTLGVPFDNRGTVSVQQGELQVSNHISGTNGVWDVASGATLGWTSTGNLSGAHSGAVAGYAYLSGTRTVIAPTTLNLSDNGLAFMSGTLNAGSAGLTNAGVFRLPSTSSSRSLAGVVVNTGTLRHEASGLWWDGASVQSSGTIELLAGNWYNTSGTNSAQNTGTVVKSGTGTFTLGVPFDNRGTVTVQQGTLDISGGGTSGSGGVWNVASGATLSFSNHTLSGSHTGTVQGLAQITGTLRVADSGASVNLSDNGLALVSGTLNAGSAGLTNAGVFRLPSTSSYRSLAGVVVNTGTLRHEATNLYWSGASVQSSGTIELLEGNWYNTSGANSAQNARGGKLLKLSSSSFSIGFLVRNAGLIDYREGSLSLNRLVQTDGETRIHAGRTLTLSNPMELQGGQLTGAGTLSANLIASDDGDPDTPPATIAPGIDDPDNPNLNPLGVLTLNGNLTMSQDAVLEIELAGTDNSDPNNPQYDQVRIGVSGYNRTVQLDGTLRLKGRDGYTPSVGDAFDVVLRTASSWNRTGQFRVVEVDPDTLPCVEVAVRYLADRVRVEVVRTGDNPDTNGDGCVDDADLLNVLFAFGQTGSSPADVNCDGIVDDADLLSVLFAFGQGC